MNGPQVKIMRFNPMKAVITAVCLMVGIVSLGWGQNEQSKDQTGRRNWRSAPQVFIQLPQPEATGTVTLERALQKINTVEAMSPMPLSGAAIGQLAWSAVAALDSATMAEQWIGADATTSNTLELYFVTFEGLFQYIRNGHRLQQLAVGDSRALLTQSPEGVGQPINHGAAVVIADTSRRRGGRRGEQMQRQMLLKVGQMAQALRLQAASLGLASLPLEPLDAVTVRQVLDLPRTVTPLYVLLVGYRPNQLQQTPAVPNPVSPTQSVQSLPIVLVVPPENFQDQELQLVQQTLTNAGVQTRIASTRLGPIHGVLGQTAYATLLLDRVKADDVRGLIFIGGPGAEQLMDNKTVQTVAREVAGQRKVLGGISTGVMILGQAGLLKQIRVTGHPSDQQRLVEAGAVFTGNAVERDGLIFSAVGPASAQSFAQTIASALKAMP